jgi:hypothetical protein
MKERASDVHADDGGDASCNALYDVLTHKLFRDGATVPKR